MLMMSFVLACLSRTNERITQNIAARTRYTRKRENERTRENKNEGWREKGKERKENESKCVDEE